MRINFILFLISAIALCQCKPDNSTCDLPPNELVDTLIKEVIIQSEINKLNFDSAQITFMKENKIPINRYKLKNLINCYPGEQEKNLVYSC